MRIGIDARFFGPGVGTGIGRYSQNLIETLERIDHDNEYVVFLRDENFELYRPSSPRFTKVRAPWRWYSRDEQLRFPRAVHRAGVDLMHYLHFNVPLFAPRPFVVTIHDLILSKYPTPRASTLEPAKYWLKQLAYRAVIRNAVRRSEKVVTVTNFTKKDIAAHFGLPENRIVVTYEGFDQPKERSNVHPDAGAPYLICVGNAYPHKNLDRLVDAVALLRARGRSERLVLVGRDDFFYRRLRNYVKDQHAESFVQFAGYVDDDTLDDLYRGASLHVFPSHYEGFGLPGLEAMARDVPVAAARASCLPEVYGDAAAYFDPDSVRNMADVIAGVLTDETLKHELRRRGRECLKRYSWLTMAQQTRAVYTTAGSHRG